MAHLFSQPRWKQQCLPPEGDLWPVPLPLCGLPHRSSSWDATVLPLPEKRCFKVKALPGWQEALKALELGAMFPGVHQRPSALPIRGQDWHQQSPERGVKKHLELKAFLDQGGDSQGISNRAQRLWDLLDTGGDSVAGTGTFRGPGWSLGFWG